jgi:[acyl-carrier-protein] S-malonyltransferase
MFPGQGAQHVGMAQNIYNTFAPAKHMFDSASSILGFDLYRLCCEGPAEKLNATVNMTTLLCYE